MIARRDFPKKGTNKPMPTLYKVTDEVTDRRTWLVMAESEDEARDFVAVDDAKEYFLHFDRVQIDNQPYEVEEASKEDAAMIRREKLDLLLEKARNARELLWETIRATEKEAGFDLDDLGLEDHELCDHSAESLLELIEAHEGSEG